MKKLALIFVFFLLSCYFYSADSEAAICWACCAKFEYKEVKGNVVIEKSPREGYEHPLEMVDFFRKDFGHGLGACNETPELISAKYKK